MPSNKEFIELNNYYPRYLIRKWNVLRLMKKYIPKKGSLIDVGCGKGSFGLYMHKLGYDVDLLDFTDKIDTSNYPINYYNTHFLSFVSEKKYDIATSFEVIEHIKEERIFFEKLVQLVKPGGYIILSIPSKMKLWNESDELAGHYRRYEKKDLEQLAEKFHLQVLEIISYGFPFDRILRIFTTKALIKKSGALKGKPKESLSSLSGMGYAANWIEKILKGLVWLSKVCFYISIPFNRFDFSDGYIIILKNPIRSTM